METIKNIKPVDKPKIKNRTISLTFRILQSVSFGVLALGVSMMLGDYGKSIELPFSNMSITTTIFGLMGAIITGQQAKNCERW